MSRFMSSSYLITAVLASQPLVVPVWAADTPPNHAPISAPVAAQTDQAQTALAQAAGQLQAGRIEAAITALKVLVNTPTEPIRSQSRYVLAYALHRHNQTDDAIEALEGTLTDTSSPLGRAVGALRGNLLLHQAELFINTNQPDRAAALLRDYERLSVRPDDNRYNRLKFSLNPTGPRITQPLSVGVIVPQSGSLGAAGTDVIRAMQMALPSLVANQRPITLLVRDATTSAEVAAAATDLRRAGAEVVVGPLLAPAVAAAHEALGGVPLLSLSSDAAVLQNGVHTLYFLPSQQAALATQAVLGLGKTRFAALVPQGTYGEAALGGLRNALAGQNAQLVKTSFYNPTENDIGASIRELGTDFEALLLPAPGRTLPLIAAQLAYYDLDKNIQLLGTAVWQDNAILVPSASATRGGLFAAPLREEAFTTRFTQTYGAAPHPLATLGTDAAYVLAQVAVAQAYTNQNIGQILLRPEGFYAPGGALKFNSNGQTERSMSVLEITEGAFTTRTPAATLEPLPLPDTLLPEPRRGWW